MLKSFQTILFLIIFLTGVIPLILFSALFVSETVTISSVVSLGSKMIDPPVVLRARKLVADARAMGLVAETEAKTEEAR